MRTLLDPALEAIDHTAPDGRRESVSIDGAYGGERFTVHLDLPRQGSRPLPGGRYLTRKMPGEHLLASARPGRDLKLAGGACGRKDVTDPPASRRGHP